MKEPIQPPVSEPDALSHWKRFVGDVRKRLSALKPADRDDILLELSAHVHDAYQAEQETVDQARRLQRAIASLGDPDQYVHEWAAEYQLENKAMRGNPGALLRLLAVRFGQSAAVSSVVIIAGLGLAFCLMVFALGVYSVFNADAGLWLNQPNGWTLSFEAQPNADQWRPAVFPVAAILASVLGYVLILLSIRYILRRR